MAYSAPSTRSTGELCTAAIWNADVVANEIAIYAGALSVTSQAVGDILYASSTTQLARVAAVAAGQVLTSAGTGTVPAYSATPALTSADMGGTTVYGSRAITVDTGGVLNVVLASSAGDDFTVDTDKLVVSGDTGYVGLGTAAPVSLLDVRGPTGTGATPAGVLTLATDELTIVDGDQLGRIEFRSPIATAGTDAIVTAASIWSEANATFSASVNSADIVFATAASGAATEKMRILSSGEVGIATTPASGYFLDIDSATSWGLQIRTTNPNALRLIENDADVYAAEYSSYKSRGNYASPGDVVNGDHLGVWKTLAYSGTQYWATGMIRVLVDGTFTSNTRPPTRMEFHTNAANAAVTERMRIDDAGNVGIGTSAPATLLDIDTNQNADTAVTIRNAGTGTAAQATLKFGNQNGDTVGRIGALGANFTTADALQSDGFYVQSQRQDLVLSAVNSKDIRFWTGAAEAMVVKYGGNVGIGTPTPTYPLHVKVVDASIAVESTTGTNSTSLKAINTGGSVTFGIEENTGGVLITGSGAYEGVIAHSGARDMSFGTSGVRRMTIAAAGTVNVVGTFTAGTKTFQIPHPLPALKDTHHLIHGCIEGPRLDLIYRGTITLVDGLATVDLDESSGMTAGTWELLCRDPQVFVSSGGWDAVRGSVSGSTLTIECQDIASTAVVSWMVVAERQDDAIKAQTSTAADGKLILESLIPALPSE